MNIFYKLLFFLIVFFFSISTVFSTFIIYNSNFEETRYFSFQDLTLYIASNQNSSFEFQYEIVLTDNSSNQYVEIFTLSNCNISQISEQYCTELTLLDFIHSSNSSFISAIEFNIIQLTSQSNSKTIFLDFIPPTITIDYTITSQSQELFIEVEVLDNLDSTISNTLYVEIEEDDSQFRRIFNTSFQTTQIHTKFNTTINLTSSSRYIITVESRDEAGNLQQRTRSFELQDIFPPQLSNLSIVDTFTNQIKLHFTLQDESNISSWIVKSGSREYREDFSTITSNTPITKESFEVVLPQIPNSEFTIFVEDQFSNSKTHNFTSKIEIIEITNIANKISNSLQIRAQNAQNCNIRGFKEESQSFENMTSLSSISFLFEYVLPKSISEKEYNIQIECSNEFMTQQVSHTLSVDRTPPRIIEFDVMPNSNEGIDIMFNVDSTTSRVEILRNSRVLTTLRESRDFDTNTNFIFTDNQVEYPQQYTYKIRVFDEISNSNSSDEFTVVPPKTDVKLTLEVLEFDEFVRILVKTEEQITGSISHNARFNSNLNSNFNSSSVFQTPTGIVITSKNSQGNRINFENLEGDEFVIVVNRVESDFTVTIEVKDSVSNVNLDNVEISKLSSKISNVESEMRIALQESDLINSSSQINATVIDEDENELNSNLVLNSSSNFKNGAFKILLWLLLLCLIMFIIFILLKIGSTWYANIKNSLDKERAYRELRQKEVIKKKSNSVQKLFHFSFGHSKSVSFDKEIYKRLEEKKIQDTKKRLEEQEKRRKLRTQEFNQRSEYDRAKFNDLNIRSRSINFSKTKNTNLQNSTKNKYTDNYKNNSQKNFFSFLFRKNNLNNNLDINSLDNSSNNSNKNSNTDFDVLQKKTDSNSSNKDDLVIENTSADIEFKVKYSPQTSTKVDLGLDDYLQKRSKSKKWFLLQKQVDDEVKRRF